MSDRNVSKPYTAPKLVVYGEFSKLTAAGSGVDFETGPGMMGTRRRP